MQHEKVSTVVQKLKDLDLGPIRFKLMTPNNKGESWDESKMARAEKGYRQFLVASIIYPEEILVPTEDIDCVWHTHILDTRKYREDCEKFLGYFLDHFPYLGTRGAEDKDKLNSSFERTKELFAELFGAASIFHADSGIPSGCQDDSESQCAPDSDDFGHQERPRVDIKPMAIA